MKERHYKSLTGIPVLIVALALPFIAAGLAIHFGTQGKVIALLLSVVPTIVTFIALISGLYKVEPNQSAVLSLFGKYMGTTRTPGLRWNNLFFAKKKISMRVRNFESGRLKVNDSGGSPIEIAAIVVWEVTDSAEAVYNVDDYESFVQNSKRGRHSLYGLYLSVRSPRRRRGCFAFSPC